MRVRISSIRIVCLAALLGFIPSVLTAPVAADAPVTRTAPYDGGFVCTSTATTQDALEMISSPAAAPATECWIDPALRPAAHCGNGVTVMGQTVYPAAHQDCVTWHRNAAAKVARQGLLGAGRMTDGLRRSGAYVEVSTAQAGTLSFSADIAYAHATSPNVKTFRVCLELFEKGLYLGGSCYLEDETGPFSASVSLPSAKVVRIVASLETDYLMVVDNGAAAAKVEKVSYTFSS